MPSGFYKLATATVRITREYNGATIRHFPIPKSYTKGASVVYTPSGMITAAMSNAGTIYVFNGPTAYGGSAATLAWRRAYGIPVQPGKSLSLTGPQVGNAVRDVAFGTGYTYITGSATGLYAILSYLKPA